MNTFEEGIAREIESRLSDVKWVGRECHATCPFCGAPPKTEDPHFRFNPDKWAFNCWKCDEGKEGKRGDLWYLASHLGIETREPPDPNDWWDAESQQMVTPLVLYDYVDENGTLLYQVGRLPVGSDGGKRIRQRRPDSSKKNGWAYSLGNTRRVLYRLPEVLKTAQAGGTIFVVEGEKDADRLCQVGLTATTNVNGGGTSWQRKYAVSLKGASVVVIIADNDDAGYKHAHGVYEILRKELGVSTNFAIIGMPEQPEKSDVSDWLDSGAITIDALNQEVADVLNAGSVTNSDAVEALVFASNGKRSVDKGLSAENKPLSAADKELMDLPKELPKDVVSPFPLDTLPDFVRPYVVHLTNLVETDSGVAALTALSLLSSIFQQEWKVRVGPKGRNHYSPINLWVMSIAGSGGAKTPILTGLLAPFKEHANEHYNEVVKQYEAARETWEEQRKQPSVGESQMPEPKPPIRLPLDITDTTPEGLLKFIEKSGISAGVFTAEASGFLNTMVGNKYSGGKGASDTSAVNQLWSGEQPVIARAKDDNLRTTGDSTLAMVLLFQPGLIGTANHSTSGPSGFLARFLYCVPDDRDGFRTYEYEGTEGEQYEEVYKERITALLEETHPKKYNWLKGERKPKKVIPFSDEAYDLYQEVKRNRYEPMKRYQTELVKSYFTKVSDQIHRTAAILALAEGRTAMVERHDVERAIRIVEWAIPHMRRVFNLTSGYDYDTAQRVIKWVYRKAKEGEKEFTTREIRRRMKLSSVEQAVEVVTTLTIYNYLAEQKNSGRKTTIYNVNEAWLATGGKVKCQVVASEVASSEERVGIAHQEGVNKGSEESNWQVTGKLDIPHKEEINNQLSSNNNNHIFSSLSHTPPSPANSGNLLESSGVEALERDKENLSVELTPLATSSSSSQEQPIPKGEMPPAGELASSLDSLKDSQRDTVIYSSITSLLKSGHINAARELAKTTSDPMAALDYIVSFFAHLQSEGNGDSDAATAVAPATPTPSTPPAGMAATAQEEEEVVEPEPSAGTPAQEEPAPRERNTGDVSEPAPQEDAMLPPVLASLPTEGDIALDKPREYWEYAIDVLFVSQDEEAIEEFLRHKGANPHWRDYLGTLRGGTQNPAFAPNTVVPFHKTAVDKYHHCYAVARNDTGTRVLVLNVPSMCWELWHETADGLQIVKNTVTYQDAKKAIAKLNS